VTVNGERKPEPREIVFDTFEDMLTWYRKNRDAEDPLFCEPYNVGMEAFKLIATPIQITDLEELL
jgi:hypothetical protein